MTEANRDSPNKIFLNNVLDLSNLPLPILLVRHQGEIIRELVDHNCLEEFQSIQHKTGFKRAKTIISFVGEERNFARFFGVFLIKDVKEGIEIPESSDLLKHITKNADYSNCFYLELERDLSFEKFKDRLIVAWDEVRAWYVYINETKQKEVIKILPSNFVASFPGYLQILLTHKRLSQIVKNPDSHYDWYNAMKNLQAIYLISNRRNGKQYVGSTYGAEGLWQRWTAYTKGDFSGGNESFKAEFLSDKEYTNDFQYSILEVLPKTIIKNDAIAKEVSWKVKLRTRESGYNLN